jgi:hypothetical protein
VVSVQGGKEKTAALKQIDAWMTLKKQKVAEAEGQYQLAMALKHPYWMLAAKARIGQLYLALASGLYDGPAAVPSMPPSRGLEVDEWYMLVRDAFCDQMVDRTEPLDRLAVEHFLACLNNSAELGEVNEWSRCPSLITPRLGWMSHRLPSSRPCSQAARASASILGAGRCHLIRRSTVLSYSNDLITTGSDEGSAPQ